jgi:HAD superfamily hydrolase (TIGR01509 family)
MSESEKVQVPWSEIDTLLLDMDGTLLDLAFDNFFWLDLVPEEYARSTGLTLEAAREAVSSRTESIVGTLPWYCVDHWTAELGLDIAALKHRHRHRIRYLPGAREFLRRAQGLGKQLILVTNAHHMTLRIKCEQTGIDTWMDAVVTSHDFGIEKEQPAFWHDFAARFQIEPSRSLLLEDNLTVLGSARDFGIRHAIAIRQPDSTKGERDVEGFAAIDGVHSLIR